MTVIIQQSKNPGALYCAIPFFNYFFFTAVHASSRLFPPGSEVTRKMKNKRPTTRSEETKLKQDSFSVSVN